MIIIKVKKGEDINKVLKRYNRKHKRLGVIKTCRENEYFTKPSVSKRLKKQKAIYIQKKINEDMD